MERVISSWGGGAIYGRFRAKERHAAHIAERTFDRTHVSSMLGTENKIGGHESPQTLEFSKNGLLDYCDLESSSDKLINSLRIDGKSREDSAS